MSKFPRLRVKLGMSALASRRPGLIQDSGPGPRGCGFDPKSSDDESKDLSFGVETGAQVPSSIAFGHLSLHTCFLSSRSHHPVPSDEVRSGFCRVVRVGSRAVKGTPRWRQLLPEAAFGAARCKLHREGQSLGPWGEGAVWPPIALIALLQWAK